MRRMEKWLLKNKWPTITVLALITLVLAPFAALVIPNNSVEALSVIDDPAIRLMERLQDIYGNNEFIIVTAQTDDILSSKNLKLADKLTKDLRDVKGVRKVTSLTTLNHAKSYVEKGEDVLEIGQLLRPEWIESGVPKRERQKLLNTQPFERLYFSKDAKAMTFIAELDPLGTDNDTRDRIIVDIKSLVATYEVHFEKMGYTGMPVLNRFMFNILEFERFTLTGILVALSALILWVIYKRASLVLLPLGLMSVVMTWTMAFIYLADLAFSWILTLAPIVILIVSVCDSIHIINCYLKNLHLDVESRIRIVFRRVGLPCLITSLTTALGFFSIATSQLVPLRHFGIVVGIGVLLAFGISLCLLPVALSMLKFQVREPRSQRFRLFLESLLQKILQINLKYPGRVILVSVLVFGFFAYGITLVQVEQNVITMYKGDRAKKLQEDIAFISNTAGAGSEFYYFMEMEEEQFFTKPEVLKRMSAAQNRIRGEVDLVYQTTSIADIVKSLNQAFHGNDPKHFVIPETQAEVSQLLLAYESSEHSEELASLINDDYTQTRIRVFAGLSDSAKATQANIDQSLVIAKEEGLNDYNLKISGRPLIMLNTMFHVVDSQVMSLSLALLTITIVLTLQLRSIKMGLFSIVPNAIPILMTMGIIGWSGIYLSTGISMVAAVALGIAVDDTIHMLWAYQKARGEGASAKDAVVQMFDNVGMAVMNTSLILCVGFLGLISSQIHPSTDFGLLLAAACFLALVYDLFLLPALLLKWKPLGGRQLELNGGTKARAEAS